MSLLDLLAQQGVNLTGGGTAYDPAQDDFEVRLDPQGNPYNARVGSPDIFAQPAPQIQQTQPSPIQATQPQPQPVIQQPSYEQQVEDEYWNMYPPLEDLKAGEINVISDEQFGNLLGDLDLSEYRSTLDTTETAPIMQDTDDFGNPLDTDFAGQSAFDLEAERQRILDEVMMQDAPHEVNEQMIAEMHKVNQTTPNQPVQEPVYGDDWYGKHQRITQEARDTVTGAVETVGDVLGPLYKNWRGNMQRASQGATTEYEQEEGILPSFGANIHKSLGEEFHGAMTAVENPLETADAIASLFSGAIQHALPDDMAWNQDSKDMATALADFYKERYGSMDSFKKALAEEPASVVGELVGLGYITTLGGAKVASTLNNPKFLDKVDELSRQLPATQMQEGFGPQAVPGGVHGKTEVDELGFYSEAENVLNKLPQEKNNADDIKRFLLKNGVTKAEMDDIGLTEYLANNKKVDKTAMLAFVKSNKTQLDEGLLSGVSGDIFEGIEMDETRWAGDRSSNVWVHDEPEQYQHIIEDMAYEFKPDGDFYDDADIILKLNEYAPDKFPLPDDFKSTFLNTGGWSDPDWYLKMKEQAKDGIHNVDEISMLTEAIEEVAHQKYLENPVYRWEVRDPEGDIWYAEGNEDMGIMIRDHNLDPVNRSPIYSVSEANIQMRQAMEEMDDYTGGENATKWHDYTTPNLNRSSYKEYTYTPKDLDMFDQFDGGHYDEGVMSHIRTSERFDQDNSDYHFIEELQSDQHQKGRQYGYQDKDTQNQIAKAESKKKKAGVALAEHNQKFEDKGYLIIERSYGAVINDTAHNRIGEIDMTNKEYPFEISANYLNDAVQSGNKADLQKVSEDIDDFAGEYIALREKFNVALAEKGKLQNKIPNAPLKDDQWLDAMFKRSIMNAIEEGHDRVAWTNAQLQKDLYSDRYAELYENTYDKKLPSIAKKMAEKHGGKVGTTEMYFDDVHDINYIELTPEFVESFKKGQSMYGSTSVPSKKDIKHKAGEARDKKEASEHREGLLSKIERGMQDGRVQTGVGASAGLLSSQSSAQDWSPDNNLINFVKMMENAPLAVGKGQVKKYDDLGQEAGGYGTKFGLLDELTEKSASEAMVQELIKANSAVNRLVKVDLDPHQRNALVSLVYNVGEGTFSGSKALKALNKGDTDTFLKEAFDPKIGFVRGKGKILKGLVDRRAKERDMFTKGQY